MKPKTINQARVMAKVLGMHKNLYQNLLFQEHFFTPHQFELFTRLNGEFENGYPLDYIIGEVVFLENNFIVKPGVLIPRPETEIWVGEFIKKNFYKNNKINGKYCKTILIDIGAGTGVIGLSLARIFKKVYLTDIFPIPLAILQENKNLFIKNNPALKSSEIQIIKSDLLSSLEIKNIISNCPVLTLKKGLVGTLVRINFPCPDKIEGIITKSKKIYTKKPVGDYIIVSNLPYVPKMKADKILENKISFEPGEAIFSGPGGRDHITNLIRQINKLDIWPREIHLELDNSHIICFGEIISSFK